MNDFLKSIGYVLCIGAAMVVGAVAFHWLMGQVRFG